MLTFRTIPHYFLTALNMALWPKFIFVYFSHLQKQKRPVDDVEDEIQQWKDDSAHLL